jgi:NADP-dependent 3-hydroxy acid dehydrogenase YdfG
MIVFVTGATSGFGAAIARRFAAEGHRIIAAGRRQERLSALVAEFDAARVHAVTLDVRHRGSPSDLNPRTGSIRMIGSKWSTPTSRDSCT